MYLPLYVSVFVCLLGACACDGVRRCSVSVLLLFARASGDISVSSAAALATPHAHPSTAQLLSRAFWPAGVSHGCWHLCPDRCLQCRCRRPEGLGQKQRFTSERHRRHCHTAAASGRAAGAGMGRSCRWMPCQQQFQRFSLTSQNTGSKGTVQAQKHTPRGTMHFISLSTHNRLISSYLFDLHRVEARLRGGIKDAQLTHEILHERAYVCLANLPGHQPQIATVANHRQLSIAVC